MCFYIDFVCYICIKYFVNLKKNKCMLKDQIVSGFFLTGNDYYCGQILKKGLIDVYGDINYFFNDQIQKKRDKTGIFVVIVKVSKKETYNHRKGKNIFSVKTKSSAEIVSVVPAVEFKKEEALLKVKISMI